MGGSRGVGTLGLFHANSTAHCRRRHTAGDDRMNWLGLGSRNQRPLTPLQKFKAFYDIAKVSPAAKPNAPTPLPCWYVLSPSYRYLPSLPVGGCGGGLPCRHAGQHSAGSEALWHRPASDRGGSGSTWGAGLRCDATLHAAPMQLPCSSHAAPMQLSCSSHAACRGPGFHIPMQCA